jgi:hypothetical protein
LGVEENFWEQVVSGLVLDISESSRWGVGKEKPEKNRDKVGV